MMNPHQSLNVFEIGLFRNDLEPELTLFDPEQKF